jgi:CHAT domain-containing protein
VYKTAILFLLVISFAGGPPVAAFQADEQVAAQAEALYAVHQRYTEGNSYLFAQATLLDAVTLWQRSGHTARAIEALFYAADQYKTADRWAYALQLYKRLLRLAPLPGQMEIEARVSIAWIYLCYRQFNLSTRHYEQALELAGQRNDSSARALALIGLAAIDLELDHFDQFDERLSLALRVAGQENDIAKAAALALSGMAHRKQGRVYQALDAFSGSLALYEKRGHNNDAAKVLCMMSDAALSLNDKQAAFDYADRALDLGNALKKAGDKKVYKPTDSWEVYRRGWLALARAQRALGQAYEAHMSYLMSWGSVGPEFQRMDADSLRIKYMEDRQAPYREWADLTVERGKSDKAFEVVESGRARAMRDLLDYSLKREVGATDGKLDQKVKQAARRVSMLQAELRTVGRARSRRATLESELEQARQTLEEIIIDSPKSLLRPFVATVSLKRLQEKVLRPDEVLLEFLLGENRSHAWLVNSSEIIHAILPGQKEIESKVTEYVEAISTRPSNLYLERDLAKADKLSAEIYDILLGQLAGRLHAGKRLIIVPEGSLYYLPFETLSHKGRYLIEDHEISYAPSATSLDLLRQRGLARKATGKSDLLAFGDPVVGPLSVAQVRGKQKGRRRVDSVRADYARDFDLASLPNTRDEVTTISNMFASDRRRAYLGQSATEQAFKLESLKGYRRLHLATHSLIDERTPSRSGILFSLGGDKSEDGLLEVDEIAELGLECDLVVLSACQTGRGQLLRGEGIVGLTRAFLYAGAQSVAVSLWNVSDLSTAEFMKRFYKQQAAGLGAAESLRSAKREMLASPEAMRHPYYWAPFVLVGTQN